MANKNLRVIIPHDNHRNWPALVLLTLILCTLTFSAVPALVESEAELYAITMSDDSISADIPGVYTEGSIIIISLPGDYTLTGSLSNGQIIVDLEQDGKVKLFFKAVA